MEQMIEIKSITSMMTVRAPNVDDDHGAPEAAATKPADKFGRMTIDDLGDWFQSISDSCPMTDSCPTAAPTLPMQDSEAMNLEPPLSNCSRFEGSLMTLVP